MADLEIYGKRECPFAWRPRLVTAEKALPFDWLPYDVDAPDPRALSKNPERKSPLLVHGDHRLIESEVIGWYIEEAFPGRSLAPADARERSSLRLLITELAALVPESPPGKPLDDAAKARAEKGFEKLEAALADGRAFLGGEAPSLADCFAWPMIVALDQRGVRLGDSHARAKAWWARAQARPSFVETRPT